MIGIKNMIKLKEHKYNKLPSFIFLLVIWLPSARLELNLIVPLVQV